MVTVFKRRCLGITLWKSSRKHIELWICSPFWGEGLHEHKGQNSELVFLFGWAKFAKIYRNGKKVTFEMRPWKIGKRLTVRSDELHCFYSFGLPLVFVNFSTFKEGQSITSASRNIQYYAS